MDIKSDLPLISCICITKNRLEMLLKAIISFDQQDYPNKELLISHPENDLATIDLLFNILRITNIKIIIIPRPEQESIGTARNNALMLSKGEYICMWDDDDLYASNRLTLQYNSMFGEDTTLKSSIITRILLYDSITGNAYVSLLNYWGGSLLCKMHHLLNYPCLDTNKFECAPVINFLLSQKILCYIQNFPSAYTYVYHGQNATSHFNFQYICKKSTLLNDSTAEQIKALLANKVTILKNPVQ